MHPHRLFKSVVLSVFVLAAGVMSVEASIVVGPIFDPYSNTNLYVISQNTWTGAQAEAVSMGGNLMTIHSATENAFVVSSILTNFPGVVDLSAVPLWIGLENGQFGDGSGSTHAADFYWVDHSTSSYRNWQAGEPNNFSPGEYWTAINWHWARGDTGSQGTWNDTPNAGTSGFGGNTDGPYYGIVSVANAPEPSTLALAGSALLILAIRKARHLVR